MVVPTMLGRILDVLERQGESLPKLRHLSYGGGRMPVPVIERALRLLPHVDFVNAYGLTETSSTIAVLGPEDHREAINSTDEPSGGGWDRSAGRCRASRSRSAIADGVPVRRRVRPARSGSAASRSPASTSEAATSCRTAGSRRPTAGRSTPTATCTWRGVSTTSSCGAPRTCRRARSRTCSSPTRPSPTPASSACRTWSGARRSSPPSWCRRFVGHRGGAPGVGQEPAPVVEDAAAHRVPARRCPYNDTGKLLRRVLKSELADAYGTTKA